MKLSSKIAFAISFVYVGVSYLVLLNTTISVDESSMFYTLRSSQVFLPGYILGFILGFFGGNGFVFLGQVITFIVVFYVARIVVTFVITIVGRNRK